jgi:hypothetical protein
MKIFNIILVATLILLNYGCKKDTEGVSKITNLVSFELTGGPRVLVAKGGSYTDPGYKAMEGTKDVTNTVVVNSTVNGNKVGMYDVTYSAVNSDGFPTSISRTIIIYDPAAPDVNLAGDYLSTVSRVSPARGPYLDLNVNITKIAPGFFYISDFLGGFYDQGAAYKYGPDYAMTGYFQLNADNTISLVSSHIAGWGDSLSKLTNGKYDPATSTLSWDAFYSSSNYDFKVSMVKKN